MLTLHRNQLTNVDYEIDCVASKSIILAACVVTKIHLTASTSMIDSQSPADCITLKPEFQRSDCFVPADPFTISHRGCNQMSTFPALHCCQILGGDNRSGEDALALLDSTACSLFGVGDFSTFLANRTATNYANQLWRADWAVGMTVLAANSVGSFTYCLPGNTALAADSLRILGLHLNARAKQCVTVRPTIASVLPLRH